MIITIEAHQAEQYASMLHSMFVARKEVFKDRMGWDVIVADGEERDIYDDLNPLYILSVDPATGAPIGSLRLLPTTGRTMLKDVFVNHFDEPVDVSSPVIWECTRFCTHPAATGHLGMHGISAITAELLRGICEVSLQAGIAQIVGVFDKRMIRIYQRGAWRPEVIARSTGLGHGDLAVGLWDVCETALMDMRQRANAEGSVMAEPAFVRLAA
jgi:acyl homoserine lactone synthase